MSDVQPNRISPPDGEVHETTAQVALRIKQVLLQHLEGIAESAGATAIFVYADDMQDDMLPLWQDSRHRVFYITKTAPEERPSEQQDHTFIRVPNVNLTRLGQLKIAVFLALSKGLVKRGDVIVSLSGMPGSGLLDTIIVTQVGREFGLFATAPNDDALPLHIMPEVIERVVDIASELGHEGREGKPVGALFVIGDAERVASLSRQLILNPFRGYPEEDRNLLDPALEETVKEYSTLDGAFIIRGDGVIETCGAYLKTASQEEYAMPRGLGARHHAAAAITAVTDSIAVTVSESTGTVMIFRGGSIIADIEKPRQPARLPKPFASREE